MKGKLLFSESQSFGNTWAFYLNAGIALATTGLFGYGLFQQLVLGEQWGTNPASDSTLVVISLLITALTIGSSIFLYLLRLTVTVDEGAIYFRFPPFVRKDRMLSKADIESMEVVRYMPIFEYGGWGSRGFPNNKAYSVSGKDGLRIRLTNGMKLLLGTRKPAELKTAINKLKENWGVSYG